MTQEKVLVILVLIILVIIYISFYLSRGIKYRKVSIKNNTSGEYLISAGKKFNASIIYSFLAGLTGLIGWLNISEAKTSNQIQDIQTITIVITLVFMLISLITKIEGNNYIRKAGELLD
jgi:hypothetical protein